MVRSACIGHPLIETINLGGDVSTRIAKTLGQTGALIALGAADVNADLVVVGAHQRRALSRVWHESIAHGVLHSETVRLTTIVAATDFSPCGNRAVAWACSMARPGTHVVIGLSCVS